MQSISQTRVLLGLLAIESPAKSLFGMENLGMRCAGGISRVSPRGFQLKLITYMYVLYCTGLFIHMYIEDENAK